MLRNFRLPFPPSHHYKNKAAHRAYAEAVLRLLEHEPRAFGGAKRLILEFHSDSWWRDGEVNRRAPDLKNLVWELEDLIAEALGYNDAENHELIARKVFGTPGVVVTLEPI